MRKASGYHVRENRGSRKTANCCYSILRVRHIQNTSTNSHEEVGPFPSVWMACDCLCPYSREDVTFVQHENVRTSREPSTALVLGGWPGHIKTSQRNFSELPS